MQTAVARAAQMRARAQAQTVRRIARSTVVTGTLVAPSGFPGRGGGGAAGDATSIQGQPVSPTPPTAGQVLQFNTVTGEWEPGTVAGGFGVDGGTYITSEGIF